MHTLSDSSFDSTGSIVYNKIEKSSNLHYSNIYLLKMRIITNPEPIVPIKYKVKFIWKTTRRFDIRGIKHTKKKKPLNKDWISLYVELFVELKIEKRSTVRTISRIWLNNLVLGSKCWTKLPNLFISPLLFHQERSST